jgi:hypothetical protein
MPSRFAGWRKNIIAQACQAGQGILGAVWNFATPKNKTSSSSDAFTSKNAVKISQMEEI